MGRKKTRRLSLAEFEAVMLLVPRMSVVRRSAARQALVEGMTAQSVATQHGWHRSAVHNAETVVWRTYERYVAAKETELLKSAPLPKGWVRRTVVGPRGVVRQMEVRIAAAKLV